MSMVVSIRALLLLPACIYAVRRLTSPTCGFTTAPVENNIGRGYRSFVYTEPYRSSFFRNGFLLNDWAYQQYAQWLTTTMARNFPGVDPYDQRQLLRVQRDLFARVMPGYDTAAWDVVLEGRVGAISEANCIESALWAMQNKYHPLNETTTEFGAYILLDHSNTTVKVYLQTGPGSGVPALTWAFSSIERDLRQGFKLLTFLHNHYFNPNGRYDCVGTCVPSGPDLQTFRGSSLTARAEEFWITNGHDSFRFHRSELGVFPGSRLAMAGAMGQPEQLERPEGPLDAILEKEMGYPERPEGPLDAILGKEH